MLRALKADAASADLPVVVTSMEDEGQRAYALGAAAYLRKPVERGELVRTLERLCGNAQEPQAQLVVAESVVVAAERVSTVVTLEEYRLQRNGESERC